MTTSTYSSETRERMLIFGIWLVGLGSVFLIKEVMGWSWSQAWPLFVILLGVGGMTTAMLSRRHTRIGIWGIWWPLALIAAGAFLLASTSGWIAVSLPQLVGWWPVVVIVLGIWFLIGALFARDNKLQNEILAVPLGGLTQAEVRINFGGGELVVGPAQPGMLISGRFEGGVLQRNIGPARVDLHPYDPSGPFWGGRTNHWDMGITPDIPVDLRVDSGASRSTIDLMALRIRRLELHTGASDTHIRLPATGATSVHLEAGVASVALEVPAGVAAKVRGRVTIGSTRVDESRFPRSLDGWASADFETAANRVEIDVQGGLGSVTIG